MIVTGVAGFVGGHVVRALVRSGRSVVATDLAPALPDRVLAGLSGGSVTYVSGDLVDEATLDEIFDGPGAVDLVHVAAITLFAQLGRSLGEDAATPARALRSFDVNAFASWRLGMRFAERADRGRLIHLSTRAVFGGRSATVQPIGEDEPAAPAGIYGASKAAAELGVLTFRKEFDLDAAIVRITGAFGPWQGPVSWLGRIAEAVTHDRPYHSSAGRDDAYELTYVKDTVRGILAVLDAPRLEQAVYHLSSGRMVTLGEVAAAARAAWPGAEVEFGATSALTARRTALDGTRLHTELGFECVWPMPDAIADYLQVERTGEYGREVDSEPARQG